MLHKEDWSEFEDKKIKADPSSHDHAFKEFKDDHAFKEFKDDHAFEEFEDVSEFNGDHAFEEFKFENKFDRVRKFVRLIFTYYKYEVTPRRDC